MNLVEVLTANGWSVTALHRPTADLARLRRFPVTLAAGDVTDAESLARGMPAGVDAVFHVAASTSVWRRRDAAQERINVGGTRNVVAAALDRGARRLVHTSSVAAYGFHEGRITEDLPQRGAESWISYFRTKAAAEREVRSGIGRGLDAVILNPVHVLGRYDTANWSRVIAMVHERRLPGVPPGGGSFCHGGEVARAHLAAWERGTKGANYLLGGTDATFLELVRVIGEVTGRPVPRRAMPAPLLRVFAALSALPSLVTGREPDATPEGVAIASAFLHADCSRAERELGFRAVPLRVMVEDAYRWMLAEGILAAAS
jgi:nucleoside-diphosphate-sugar epimerase